MGTHSVSAHKRRTSSGKLVEVHDHQRTRLDSLRRGKKTAVEKRKRQRAKKGGWFQPRRGWNRIVRGFGVMRKRKKLLGTMVALGGVAEIGAFLAARGIGALAMGAAIALTAVAGAALSASGNTETRSRQRRTPSGGSPEKAQPVGKPTVQTRRADGKPETKKDREYFDKQQKKVLKTAPNITHDSEETQQ